LSIKRGGFLRVFIFALIFVSCGLLGYYAAKSEPLVSGQPGAASEVPAGAAGAEIREGAAADWDYYYMMCAHHVYAHKTADKSMVGLTLTGFRAAFPDVRVVSFAPEKLSLSKSFCCYCPDHFLLKRRGDALAVLRTMTGTAEQEIFMEIPYGPGDIAGDEEPALETGKVFDSLAEIYAYLENVENK